MNTSSILADQLDRLLAQTVDAKLLRGAESGTSNGVQKQIDELGLALALVPEAAGGAGLNWTDVGGVFETLGYHAAPAPLGESIIARWAMARAGLPCTDVHLGIVAEVLATDSNCSSVSGQCIAPWGHEAQHVAAIAVSGERTFLCELPVSSGATAKLSPIGRDPRLHIRFDTVTPVAAAPVDLGPDGLLSTIAVLRASQIAGALSRILGLSIDYGNTRVQFGRPIGKFQAIQHMIAELAAEAAAAKAGAQFALRRLDTDSGIEAAAVAKIRASIAAGKGAAIAHEVHGAIGVTEEHALHYYTRRLWQWREEAGDEAMWSERLGQAILKGNGAMLWPKLLDFSGGDAKRYQPTSM